MQEIGPYIFFGPEEGDFQLAIEAVLKRIMILKGFPLNHIAQIAIKNVACEEVKKLKNNIKQAGFPLNVKLLFEAKTKNEAEKVAKNIIITSTDLTHMIANCDQLNFTHSRKHRKFIPDDVIPTKEEKSAFCASGIGILQNKKAKKFARKIMEHTNKRRYLSAHLFEDKDKWHVFYFDDNDMYVPLGQNHY